MITGPETYKAIAEALPWEIQDAVLTIRDQEVTQHDVPKVTYIALYELQLIEEPQREFNPLELSRLGKHIADYCTC